MKNLSFGMNGLNGNTPKWIKWVYRAFGVAGLVWVVISGNYPEIPEHLQNQINKAILCGGGVVYTICQFFGYATPETEEKQQAQ